MNRLLTILFISFLTIKAYSQIYPVQASTTLIPPYSTHLVDYVAPGSQRLALNIFLADINRAELNVRVRLRIEGQGIRLETKHEYLPEPLILRGGVPERLTAPDLLHLFNPEHLNFQGITRREFLRTGALPEGLYQFCFEVLEYNRGVKISNSACAMAWLILNDPPIINLPRNGEKIKAQEPQYVTFQWTPRHTGSPNSAFSTEYEFSMVEIWPDNRNPNDAMLTSPPIYETTTQSTTLIYGPAETPLIPGRRYAFRIRAKSMMGIDEMDLFRNDGYSEVYTFIYGDPCNAPEKVSASTLSSTRFKVEWDPLFNHTEFTFRYREAGEESGSWIESSSFLDEIEISSLKAATTYEYQVAAGCGTVSGEFSEIATVTTEKRPEGEFVCGADVGVFDLSNTELIESLKPGDYIYAGDFEIKLDSVSGSGGTFTGGGKVVIPFLNFVRVRTVFENIQVNTDYRVIKGNVYTYWDPESKLMFDGTRNGTNKGREEGAEPDDITQENEKIVASVDSLYQQTIVPADSTNMLATTGDGTSNSHTSGSDPTAEDTAGEPNANGTGSLASAGQVQVNGAKDNASGVGTAGNNTSADASIADADLKFGPLAVKFTQPPESTSTDAEGFCAFDEVEASFILSLKGQENIAKEITIENALISFKKHCETDEFKDVEIKWTNASGLSLGKIKFIEANLKSVSLQIDGEGNLSGSLGLSAALSEDQMVDEIISVKKGLTGDFTFKYSGGKDFKGVFGFGGIKNVNIEVVKNGNLIGSMKNGVLDDKGVLTGDVIAGTGIKYQSEGIDVSVNKFSANITYSILTGPKINYGKGEFTLSGIKGLDGTLKIGLDIQENAINTKILSSKLSGYGFTFSKMNIRAIMTKHIGISEISGSFDVQHKEFSSQIKIRKFEVKEGRLVSFLGEGQVTYKDLDVKITNTHYNAEDELIVIDAYVEVDNGGMKVAASVNDFTIDKQGSITFGGYNANVSGQMNFGPVRVALKGEVTDEGKFDGKYRKYAADASFYLTMKNAKGVNKEVAIANGKLTFIKHKKEDLYREAELKIEGANIPVGEIYGINTALTELDLKIKSEGEFSSSLESQGNVFIEEGSFVGLEAALTEDKNLNNLIVLRKGLEGQIKFNFNKGKDLVGDFDFGGVKNINLYVAKNGKEIAALKDGILTREGTFTGKLSALQGASYKSGAFDITVNQFDLGVQFNIYEGWQKLDITSGTGKFTVKNITGVQGTFKVGVNYGVDGNFNAELLSKESEISALGMQLKDLNLKAEFTESLDLNFISGSLKAYHPGFNSNLNVSSFKVEGGKLQALEANGAIKYKNFNFDLQKSSYKNGKLSVTAKVEINDAGKLEVDRFEIDGEGRISVGSIKGNLHKPLVSMAFDATFKEHGFKGSFNGKVKFIGLEGTIDFGTHEGFNYGYLSMAAESRNGLPLGPTGLQLTKVGGQLGYNYYLKFSAGKISGFPKQYNYLVGLTLGISDAANMFAAEGTTVVQFGNDKLQLSLLGKIKAPRSNPIVESNFNINYYLPDNTIDGSLSVDVNVPAQSGYIFQTTTPANLSFSYASEDWHVEGGVKASMFRKINFVGNTSLSKTESSISGYIRGMASFSYSKSFNYDFYVADIDGSLELGFNSNVDASIGANGFEGSIGVHVYGKGELTVSTVLGNVYGAASVDCFGEVSYKNNQGLLRGEATISVQSTLADFEELVSIENKF